MEMRRDLGELAHRLRHAATRSEARLWSCLRDRQFRGFKFRRQYPAGRYILDFYCPALRLAIEMDGRHHAQPWMTSYDRQRARYLETRGVTILRISNESLVRDSQLVFAQIDFVIASLSDG